MDTQNPPPNPPNDSAFPHINGIDMEVAVELLGQEIAKRSTAIADEEAKATPDREMLSILNEEQAALRERQQALRADKPEDIEAYLPSSVEVARQTDGYGIAGRIYPADAEAGRSSVIVDRTRINDAA